MIIYTDRMPARFDGYNLGPVTLIRPSLKHDEGLHAHEATHRRQFYRNPLMGLWYLFSRKARLAYEVEAYREQLKHTPPQSLLFAEYLSSNYDLNITRKEAWFLLTKQSV